MSNRVGIIPLGDPSAANEIISCLSQDGQQLTIKSKYFQVDLSFEFDPQPNPPAVIWIGYSRFTDLMPPKTDDFSDAEVRLLLRCFDEGEDVTEIPEALADWEVENFCEVVNVRLNTIGEEFNSFIKDQKRSSLLDEDLQPAGCRILETLELCNWPYRTNLGKPLIEQKVDALTQLLENPDPHADGFDKAMELIMSLKDEIKNLPDDQRHKYAADIAIAFGKCLGLEEDEE